MVEAFRRKIANIREHGATVTVTREDGTVINTRKIRYEDGTVRWYDEQMNPIADPEAR